MAKVTYIGNSDPQCPAQGSCFGYEFKMNVAVDVDDPDILERLSKNPMFEVEDMKVDLEAMRKESVAAAEKRLRESDADVTTVLARQEAMRVDSAALIGLERERQLAIEAERAAAEKLAKETQARIAEEQRRFLERNTTPSPRTPDGFPTAGGVLADAPVQDGEKTGGQRAPKVPRKPPKAA